MGEAVAQKNATPTREQANVIAANGLQAAWWVVVKDFSGSMIVRHRISGEFDVAAVRRNWSNEAIANYKKALELAKKGL